MTYADYVQHERPDRTPGPSPDTTKMTQPELAAYLERNVNAAMHQNRDAITWKQTLYLFLAALRGDEIEFVPGDNSSIRIYPSVLHSWQR